jgi:AhpD family alkylhydroperoxidase
MEMTMTKRIEPYAANPQAFDGYVAYAKSMPTTLEPSLQHLVKLRSSQINGCARCLHMHAQEALKDGERQERIWLLDAWRDAGVYTSREQAALAWTDALTCIAEKGAPDDVYGAVIVQFTAAEVVELTLLINIINGFNRLAVAFHAGPMGLSPVKAAA